MEEVVPPGMELPPGGHAGKASGKAAVEADRAFPEPGKIRRYALFEAVRIQHVAVQRIEHDHDRFHAIPPDPPRRPQTPGWVLLSQLEIAFPDDQVKLL